MKNTILITGGSSGFGLQLAKILISRNNKVLICGRSKDRLLRAKEVLEEVEIFQCDISSEKECLKLYQWIKQDFPNCNWLINNAAIVNVSSFLEDEVSLEKANDEFETNFFAPMRLSKLFLPLLLRNPDAKLINVTTGLVYAPKAAYPFYNATKAALHSFTQVLRIQLKKEPVKIIELLLPAIDTPWHKGNPPKIAISVERAVDEALKKIEKGDSEIRVAGVNILYWLARIAPAFAVK